jgi:hypothetical protein
MKARQITLCATAAAMVGCASIVHGTRQDIGFSSSPTDAAVKVDGVFVGNTPVNAKLTRKDDHVVSISMAGYQTYDTTFSRGVSGWLWGSLAFGGLVGLTVDAIDGGLYELTPGQVDAETRASDASVTQVHNTMYVNVALKPDPSWQRVGALAAAD